MTDLDMELAELYRQRDREISRVREEYNVHIQELSRRKAREAYCQNTVALNDIVRDLADELLPQLRPERLANIAGAFRFSESQSISLSKNVRLPGIEEEIVKCGLGISLPDTLWFCIREDSRGEVTNNTKDHVDIVLSAYLPYVRGTAKQDRYTRVLGSVNWNKDTLLVDTSELIDKCLQVKRMPGKWIRS